MTSGATVAEGEGNPAKLRLVAELLLLFVGVPLLLLLVPHSNVVVVPVVWLAAYLCWRWLRRQEDFDPSRLFGVTDFRRQLFRTIRVFGPLGALALVLAYLAMPGDFLAFPKKMPLSWLAFLVGYPVFSAYPQEVIYRAYFYHRFRPLFPRTWQLVLANTLLFGWVHVFFGGWIMPVLGAAGGLLFSRTYFRSGSLLQAAIEHGLWGDLLLATGIGWAIYAGMCG